MGLSLLSPWFLLGAAAVAVPIVLHLLARHTAPDVRFPATRFVPEAPVEQRRRRRVSDWLLLALRCAALLLLALGFARPFLAQSSTNAGAPARLVAVDTSFSMTAPGTWAAAQAEALAAVDAAPAGRLVGVVALDQSARIVSPLSVDRAAARSALASLQPGAGATDYAALAAPAAELLAGRTADVVLVTDLQRSGLRAAVALPAGTTLTVAGVPPARANLAVESLSRDGADVVATLANHGLEARTAVLRLSIDGAEISRREVALDEGATLQARFEGAARPVGLATARLDDAAGLAADDERYLVLDEPRATAVWVVGSPDEAFYLERALTSVRRVPRATVRLATWSDVESPPTSPPAEPPAGGAASGASTSSVERADGAPDVVIVQSTRGMSEPARRVLRAWLERGAGLLVAAGPEVDAGALSQLLGAGDGVAITQADGVPLPAALAPADVRHAAFAAYAERASAYAGIRFDALVRVQPAEGDAVVARFDNGLPALVERRVGRGRMLVLASDLGARWNQWPLSPTFVPWVHDAVAHLAARQGDSRSFTVADAPAGVAAVPGAHLMADGRRVVVNIDARESAIDLLTEDELAAAVVEAPAAAAPAAVRAAADEAAQSWWWYLVAAMLLVVVVESAVGARPTAG